jgi:hypothetical protein
MGSVRAVYGAVVSPAAILIGAVGGAINAAVVSRQPARDRGAGLAVFLAVAAGIYLGFGLRDGRPAQAVVQALGALPFLAVAAGWPRAVRLLGIAWLAHGAWDGLHELGVLATTIPSWYPGMCFAWDVVVGLTALVWARAAGGAGP